jgi:hypothetical protein
VTINIGGKLRHLGYFGAGQPGEVDAALAFDTVVRALGPAGRSTNNASERTNFEVPGPDARGLSREQAADVEAKLKRHLRLALLAAGRDKGMGEAFEQEPSGQVLPAPAARSALPQNTMATRAPRGLLRPSAGAAGLVGAGRADGGVV